MEIIINADEQAASRAAARVVARLVREKPDAVLGLATGSTPLMLYRELVRLHREDELDFSRVSTFNLDEYVGLDRHHVRSYHAFMWDNMANDVPAFCAEYEKKIVATGGIDLQVLGVGSDGHIGFNEPTSSFGSRTRIKTLTRQTMADNARFFGGDEAKVPQHCITMGIGTIMEARTILMLAFGKSKAAAVAASIEGPVAAIMPASILQHHPAAKIFIDEPAAAELQLSDYYRWVYEGKPDWQRDA
jgi:glucosamine-6-phosphate deaminase